MPTNEVAVLTRYPQTRCAWFATWATGSDIIFHSRRWHSQALHSTKSFIIASLNLYCRYCWGVTIQRNSQVALLSPNPHIHTSRGKVKFCLELLLLFLMEGHCENMLPSLFRSCPESQIYTCLGSLAFLGLFCPICEMGIVVIHSNFMNDSNYSTSHWEIPWWSSG